jgi:hypothetical protein
MNMRWPLLVKSWRDATSTVGLGINCRKVPSPRLVLARKLELNQE